MKNQSRHSLNAFIKQNNLPHTKLYIIRNRKVTQEWSNLKPSIHYIIDRAISTLTKNQGIGDLYRLYAVPLTAKINYNLAYIPESFSY